MAIVVICACALAGCAKSKEEAQIDLIECAGFQTSIPGSLWEPVYKEMRDRGVQPVDIQAIPILANAYRNTYTVTFGRGAEVNARWDKGATAGKAAADKRDAATIAKYLKSCIGTFNDALRRG